MAKFNLCEKKKFEEFFFLHIDTFSVMKNSVNVPGTKNLKHFKHLKCKFIDKKKF